MLHVEIEDGRWRRRRGFKKDGRKCITI